MDRDLSDYKNYFGPDYNFAILEIWLQEVMPVKMIYTSPMTHEEYLLLRTARLTMMRAMLGDLPEMENRHATVWYNFATMGDLLDALPRWPRPYVSDMAVVMDFFTNPPWLPVHPHTPPFYLHDNRANRVFFDRQFTLPSRPQTARAVRNEVNTTTNVVTTHSRMFR